MLGSGTTITLGETAGTLLLAGETATFAWAVGTPREYSASLGGLPPQEQAAMLWLRGPAAIAESMAPTLGALKQEFSRTLFPK